MSTEPKVISLHEESSKSYWVHVDGTDARLKHQTDDRTMGVYNEK